MRILITGAAGMLGTDARRIFAGHGHEVIPTDVGPAATGEIRPLDITDFDALRALFAETKPDLIFHGAAYTNVDGCERDPDLAYRVNAIGTGCVAAAAEEIGAALVAISTDFVFDGAKSEPYTEFDSANPISHYGASKRAGEILALQNCRRTYVVRTAWLYGVHGKNFPFTMLNFAKTKSELPIVGDQVGTPTYTVDLVHAVLTLLKRPLYGVYHVSNSGQCSWAEFAQTVFAKTNTPTTVNPITSDEYAAMFGSPTRRPSYSVMRHAMLTLQGCEDLRPWPDALDAFLEEARAAGKI